MSVQSIKPSFLTFQDIDGQPLENGSVYVGTAGLDAKTNQIQAYWDEAKTLPATQPIATLNGYLSNAGTPGTIYVDADDYSILVENKNNSTVYSAANKQEVAYKTQYVYVKDYGAVGDGTTDDTAAIQAAIDSIGATASGTVLFEHGQDYAISSTITNNGSFILFEGNNSNLRLTANASYVLSITSTACTVKNLEIIKASGVTADGIFVSGLKHVFERITGTASLWPRFFHLQDVRESHFSYIRLDNDVSGKTGNIFELDYSVNNTICESFLGYCNTGVFMSDVSNPVGGSKSEGITITDCIMVFCNRAIYAGSITSLHVDNCVLDFCTDHGVFVNNGNSVMISNTWIANDASSTGSFIGAGSLAGYDGMCVSNCFFVGNAGAGVGSALSLGGDYQKAIGNHTRFMNGGIINGADSYAFANTTDGVGTDYFGTANFSPDYEEGAWVPTVTSASGTLTTVTASGRYEKNGRTVTARGRVFIDAVGTGAGTLNITLPFASANTSPIRPVGPYRENALTGDDGSVVPVADGSANMTLNAVSALATNQEFLFSIVYEV